MKIQDHIRYMSQAMQLAQTAIKHDEVPVGALVVGQNGEILSQAHNQKEKLHNPCGHAEILAIQKAAKKLGNWRLDGCTLYVTLEPCIMCLAAMTHARIDTLIFGAYDLKGGALSLKYNIYKDKRLNHRFSIIGGINHISCSDLITKFFRDKRVKKHYTN